jgi:hypothetical protein
VRQKSAVLDPEEVSKVEYDQAIPTKEFLHPGDWQAMRAQDPSKLEDVVLTPTMVFGRLVESKHIFFTTVMLGSGLLLPLSTSTRSS